MITIHDYLNNLEDQLAELQQEADDDWDEDTARGYGGAFELLNTAHQQLPKLSIYELCTGIDRERTYPKGYFTSIEKAKHAVQGDWVEIDNEWTLRLSARELFFIRPITLNPESL